MNYVRKLGFEEQPDYDFLRELFSKVLRASGEMDDGIFDWMLLNNGKGWEAGNVSFRSCFSDDDFSNQILRLLLLSNMLNKRIENELIATGSVNANASDVIEHERENGNGNENESVNMLVLALWPYLPLQLMAMGHHPPADDA